MGPDPAGVGMLTSMGFPEDQVQCEEREGRRHLGCCFTTVLCCGRW